MAFQYQGGELDLFAAARNWKSYYGRFISPLLKGSVLDVGAGLGINAPYLMTDSVLKWVCLEPDPDLAQRARNNPSLAPLQGRLEFRTGSTLDLGAEETFDAILYIDVLEHIARDREELSRAARHLRGDGRLIVLAPACPLLYSEFDRGIGHVRRYDAAGLQAIRPELTRIADLRLLDSAGFFASLANRFLLRKPLPSPADIAFWDRRLVPCSRWLDRMLAYRFGKSILAVFARTAPNS